MTREERLQKQREYYKKNKEKIKLRTSIWQRNNLDKFREYNKRSYDINKEKFIIRNTINRLKRTYLNIKRRCAMFNIPFDIEIDDLNVPDICPYLGVPMTGVLGEGRLPYNWSVDRIDCSKGYIKGNIQIISEKANRMKNDASLDELLTFAKNVLKLHDKS